MNIKAKDIITLSDNNEYVVVAITKYNNIDYLYLINISNKNDIKFMYYDNGKLRLINDEKLLNEIIPLFLEIE